MKNMTSLLPNSKRRLSVSEMETSNTRCKHDFMITSLFFDENVGFPVRAQGAVRTKLGRLIQVNWDQFGECTFEGQRVKSFDLIKRLDGDEVSLNMDKESPVIGLL